jgi:hypothetical protein
MAKGLVRKPVRRDDGRTSKHLRPQAMSARTSPTLIMSDFIIVLKFCPLIGSLACADIAASEHFQTRAQCERASASYLADLPAVENYKCVPTPPERKALVIKLG